MPKSTYYYEISKVDTVDFRNIELTEEIKKIFSQHKGGYGVRRRYRELLRRGNSVNHKRGTTYHAFTWIARQKT